MIRQTVILLFLLFSDQAHAIHLYFAPGKKNVEFGTINGINFSRHKITTLKTEEINDQSIAVLIKSQIDSSHHTPLIYFHCYLGNTSIYHSFSVQRMKAYFDNGKEEIIISIIWTPALSYSGSWHKAFKKGLRIAPLIKGISNTFSGNVNVLCHSMGNRVFEGVISANHRLNFNKVILAAADVKWNAFETGLKNLLNAATEIHVLTHHRDRMLKASSLIWKNKRLGLHGASISDTKLKIHDCTSSKALLGKSHNHLYFIFSNEVRNEIGKILVE